MPPKKQKTKKPKKNKVLGSDEDEEVATADEYFSKSDIGEEDSDGEVKKPNINMLCKYTHYVVVKEAGKLFLEFHLTRKEKSDWDINWSDGPISVQFLKNMQLH